MKQLLVSLLTLFTLGGCTLSPLPFENDASSQMVNKTLVCAKQVDIFPVSINGINPPKASFDYSIKKLRRYMMGKIVVHETVNLSIKKDKINDFIHDYGTGQDIERLADKEMSTYIHLKNNTEKKESSIVMIYTPALSWDHGSKNCLRGIAFRHSNKTNIVAYNGKNINNAPVISDVQAWKIVLTHEVGHRLGVPAKKTHNKNGHCTSRECIMYAKPDWQAVVSVIFQGMPYDFCDKCKAELKEAKTSCGG